MKTHLILASLATATAMTFTLPAFAADSAQGFVDKAAAGGMFEVDSSKIAEGTAQDQAVKDFAQKMIDDHGAANAKLETIAGEQKLTLPKELDAKRKADLDTLKTAKGAVDKPYVQMQRDAHSEAVTLFESYAKDGDNAQLKTFAAETLSTLKMHKDMIEKIATTGDAASTTSSTTPAVATTGATNPAAPVPGANSFTEEQAKTRLQDAGFTDVSALTKDDKGIWRGQATKDGKNTTVALDYQGNVVAGAN
ncbi:DUF4142 domain-containing protein [Mesorhizobium sp. M7A.F.Ca.US.011.01.1.1]|uniref:DUF4142 domain-containing protein n=1 Tax=Mesorhizobium sp. M7A.F.Ca.US.011.01.1.1 TaxID=2496741 RepID=UPI000FCA5BA0|nr:DUF4142 domain-containing protein [Mesorhizobium sp. M7A.F.Ca.US.011.01.1.1]RUX23771.1 DUF4142 domain-containing protein [Mesorhizobium sp. M7A.F.Ca.US.011.01.1.1]